MPVNDAVVVVKSGQFWNKLFSWISNNKKKIAPESAIVFSGQKPSQTKPAMIDFWAALPNEIGLIVLSYLSFPDLLKAQQVNRQLYRLTNDPFLWKAFFKQHVTLAPHALSFTTAQQYKNFVQKNDAVINALRQEAEYYIDPRFVNKTLPENLFLSAENYNKVIALITLMKTLLEEPFPSLTELDNALNEINTSLGTTQFEVWNIGAPVDENTFYATKTLTLKGLTRLTPEFMALPHLNLVQNLDLNLSRLRQLPLNFSLFTHLKKLDLNNNPLSTFPTMLLQAPFTTSLKDLNISFTEIREIPTEISALSETLETLNIAGLHLATLPASLGELAALNNLYFVGNTFAKEIDTPVLPDTLLKLKPSVVTKFTSRGIKFKSAESAVSLEENNNAAVSKTHLISMNHNVSNKETGNKRNAVKSISELCSESNSRKKICSHRTFF